MKIVVLGLRGIPGIQGGVETHCEHLYPRIAARGHDITVVSRKPYVTSASDSYRGVRLLPLPSPKSRSFEAFAHTFLGVLRARTLSPDIVHIHAIGPALMVPIARLLGMRVIYTNHGPDYDRQKWGRAAKTILKTGEALGSRFANAIIAISKPIAEHLLSRFGRRAAIIPNGVVIRDRVPAGDTLASFGLDAGRYVLGVGRLVPEKGFHDLIDAFVQARMPGWKLAIVGRADHEGAYSTELLAKAAMHPDVVVMAGFQTGVPLAELYSNAGLFALPSYHEGLPIVLLEAMSYGLPVVASDIPANRQVNLPEARFFPAGDVDAAARRLVALTAVAFAPEDQSRQIAAIRADFDWDTIADQTIDVYADVAKGASRRALRARTGPLDAGNASGSRHD